MINDALDHLPEDYPGSYQDYICALAAGAMQEITSWGRWGDELERSCRTIVFYTALSRFVTADLTDELPSPVQLETLGRKLKNPLLWDVLEKMNNVPIDQAQRALDACASALEPLHSA